MNRYSVACAVALMGGFGTASAVTVDRADWTSTVTGLDSYLVGVSHFPQSSSADRTIYTFKLPDQTSVPTVTISLDGFEGVDYTDFYYAARWTFDYADGYENGGIAFSKSTAKFVYGGQQYSTISVTPTITVSEGGGSTSANVLPKGGLTFTLTDLYFGGGKGLNPSPDSSCADFSCMVPFTTNGIFAVELVIAPAGVVPEPGAIGLSLAGLCVAGACVRRRLSSAQAC